ncbi:MAG: 30S ribosomal protein S16 [Candidatus Comchoanobacterales bacterium]
MFKIRLRRDGRKDRPFYHLVAIDSRKARDAKEKARLGYYDIVNNKLSVDFELVDKLISQGAQMTDTAKALIKRARKQDN